MTVTQVNAENSFAAIPPARAGVGRLANSMGTTPKPSAVKLPHQCALPWICGLVAALIAAKNSIGGYGDIGIYLDVGREFVAGGIDIYRDRPNAGPWAYPHIAALPFAFLHLVASNTAARWIWSALLGLGTALLLRATAGAPPGKIRSAVV